MPFRTKIDFSDNRQAKQRIETIQELSGSTHFGVPFSSLPSGVDTATTGISQTYTSIASTFSGNSGTTNYTWYDTRMSLGEPYLSALTPSNSGITQTTGNVYAVSSATTIDGNTVNLAYTGVSFSILPISFYDLGGGNYSGTVTTVELDILSATTLDFTGRTIWADVSGITRTQKLIITNNPQINYVWTCLNSEGLGGWAPTSGASSGATSVWSAGTGSNSAVLSGSNSTASGDNSVAEGNQTQALGLYSHAEGYLTIASSYQDHAEGDRTTASGGRSHAEGGFTTASGDGAHAEGVGNIASGVASHVEGSNNTASSSYSHAEGQQTTASNESSHAQGKQTIASGRGSHSEGNLTQATGDYSHAEGVGTLVGYTTASGYGSHAEGSKTTASGDFSHAGGTGTTAGGAFSFVHGSASTTTGTTTIILGSNITGNTDNMVYVSQLNIKTVGAGPGTTDIGVDANGNVVDQASDRKLKENINTIEDALSKVIALRGVTYNWKDREKGGDALKLGFIAQEVNSVIPELAYYNPNGDYMGVHYKDVTALLVEAIKELVTGTTIIENFQIETQTILAEDNDVQLNYSGNQQTAIGGGIRVLHAMGQDQEAEFITDENGDWITNNDIKAKALTIPLYTPTSSNDNTGSEGNITRDDDYIYIKTNSKWKRTKLEEF